MSRPAALALVASAALHGALFAWLVSVRPRRPPRVETIAVEIEEVPRPVPTAPLAPRREPEPPVITVPKRVPPRRSAAVPPPGAPPPRSAEALPPPPNAPAPAPPPQAQGPVRIGISLSASTTASGAPAPSGGTLYGTPPTVAPDVAAGPDARGERYAPPTQVTALPEAVDTRVPKDEYPAEAREARFEGVVKLLLLVDEAGTVKRARVLSDPGKGLGPAAARIARKYFRFRPARRGDEPVATEIPFSVRFELP